MPPYRLLLALCALQSVGGEYRGDLPIRHAAGGGPHLGCEPGPLRVKELVADPAQLAAVIRALRVELASMTSAIAESVGSAELAASLAPVLHFAMMTNVFAACEEAGSEDAAAQCLPHVLMWALARLVDSLASWAAWAGCLVPPSPELCSLLFASEGPPQSGNLLNSPFWPVRLGHALSKLTLAMAEARLPGLPPSTALETEQVHATGFWANKLLAAGARAQRSECKYLKKTSGPVNGLPVSLWCSNNTLLTLDRFRAHGY
ncbi:hypothetical protein T492DRAFT_1077451, partial [Pavlovales sp. CCMP2436]